MDKPSLPDSTDDVLKSGISAVINTYNAAATLAWAIDSLTPWVDEVIVVDMHSTDATRDLAVERGARVYLHEHLGYADPARAYAVSLALHEWIFVLDADEVVPRPLSMELQQHTVTTGAADVVFIPWHNRLFGELARHGTWGPASDMHPRFFRNGTMKYGNEVHNFEAVQKTCTTRRLSASGPGVAHFNYLDVSDFLTRTDRYTEIEAKALTDAGSTPKSGRMLRQATLRFVQSYVRNNGWRDGQTGLIHALLQAFYRVIVEAKHRQLATIGDRSVVLERYETEAQALIAEYNSCP